MKRIRQAIITSGPGGLVDRMGVGNGEFDELILNSLLEHRSLASMKVSLTLFAAHTTTKEMAQEKRFFDVNTSKLHGRKKVHHDSGVSFELRLETDSRVSASTWRKVVTEYIKAYATAMGITAQLAVEFKVRRVEIINLQN